MSTHVSDENSSCFQNPAHTERVSVSLQTTSAQEQRVGTTRSFQDTSGYEKHLTRASPEHQSSKSKETFDISASDTESFLGPVPQRVRASLTTSPASPRFTQQGFPLIRVTGSEHTPALQNQRGIMNLMLSLMQ